MGWVYIFVALCNLSISSTKLFNSFFGEGFGIGKYDDRMGISAIDLLL